MTQTGLPPDKINFVKSLNVQLKLLKTIAAKESSRNVRVNNQEIQLACVMCKINDKTIYRYSKTLQDCVITNVL